MSLRRRMVLLTAAAVTAAVLLSAFACYLAVQSSLRGRVDRQLRVTATGLAEATRASSAKGSRFPPLPAGGPAASIVRRIPEPSLQTRGEIAVFTANGTVYHAPQDHTNFGLTRHDLAVARGIEPGYYRDAQVGATAVRAYVTPAGPGRAVVAVQSLTELHDTLHNLAIILVAIALVGVLLAGMFGLLVARAAARPVHALRQAAEHVGTTGDLTRRIQAVGRDDLGRLGESFNAMLAALGQSRRTEQQLIGDASHELRTPIASLRMNLEVLARNPDMDERDRAPLLADLIVQSSELGVLVEDLLETARDGEHESSPETFRLDEIVRSEVERWGTHHPDIRLQEHVEPCEILGHPERVRRAVSNILDNAIKWSAADGRIEVALAGGELSIRDHGPGFCEEDLPQVFDRFYRSPAARSVPGSGLGLSIVRKVAKEHEGAAYAANAPGGGALVTLVLKAAPAIATPMETPLALRSAWQLAPRI
jgi:two-component system sensor histidine kinase MprB